MNSNKIYFIFLLSISFYIFFFAKLILNQSSFLYFLLSTINNKQT